MAESATNEAVHDGAPPPALVTIVESDACHFCADAHQVLADFAVDYPLEVDTVDVRSETGRLLVARHRATMTPLVLIDGAFFSNGRLPRRKLAKHLIHRYGAPTTGRSVPSGGPHG
ncbi:glutaredoxin [Nocardioides taihuensis]|jgi:glutaredoxin|uniref:Glutaredoxin n=1 Tax=Nocardioides taihuensis TaxID=1835606 RepID=A0ABW0BCU2_9ACTN